MAIREDLVASAVTFLQDPSVSGSPLENRINFLRSKNLTQEEIDASLARVGEPSAASYNYNARPVAQAPPPAYGQYQPGAWQQPPPVPQRDWRDWFIMATVVGGVGYGAYTLAKRYVYPLIAPPTPPQLEQDKASIDASFERAFALLDQLGKDTESLKASEQARTDRLDNAINDFESVINDLTAARNKREQEARRLDDEIRALRELIPKAIEGQKEANDARLQELNTELKSLKTLMSQRLNSSPAPTVNTYRGMTPVNGASAAAPSPTNGTATPSAPASETPRPAATATVSTESAPTLQGRTGSPFNTGAPAGIPKIPAWQLAAKSSAAAKSPSVEASGSASGSGSQQPSSS